MTLSLLEETNASGAAQADYIYLNGRPIAVLNGSTLYYLHDDMLGTPQLATDINQAVAWQASYDPFGQASVSGTVTQNLRLPGQYFDVESGWNHNGFRDYLPTLGRYAEPDPLGRLGSGNNLYAYVYDNPTNLADPLGLCPSNATSANPCRNANAANLDYNTANGYDHIMQNHAGGGKAGKSVYAGDWTAIQALNSSTLSFGYLAPSIFQRTGSITLQWAAPQPFSWLGISNYIGYDPSGKLTTTNRLVVLSNCSTVVTSYPVPD